ncbi:unnamed protein product [Ilex paraguariensis]|uniref:Secreted protein n=1 Tax=Ilex paraguariensis TaxID=185542 RepID=A0ABC8RFW0_9AQUA
MPNWMVKKATSHFVFWCVTCYDICIRMKSCGERHKGCRFALIGCFASSFGCNAQFRDFFQFDENCFLPKESCSVGFELRWPRIDFCCSVSNICSVRPENNLCDLGH